MKLRNKKTGDHGEYKVISAGNLIRVRDSAFDKSWQYDCLKSFNDEWEDYKTSEPLIKDEKIRKAVRAWAEVNKEEELEVMGGCSVTAFKSLYNHTEIDFNCSWKLRDSVYTIEELCGEEK